MTIAWPATPALGTQVIGPRGEVWEWDNEKWIGRGTSSGIDDVPNDELYGRRNGVWDQVPIPADIPEDTSVVPIGGRLRFISSSEIGYFPFNGGWMRIDGKDYALPATGIRAGHTGVSINGISGQNLVNGTFYYVYLFDDNGDLKIDYSTTGHQASSTPGNVGIEIKQGDDTRSLLGIVMLSGNLFRDDTIARYVRTWINRKSAALLQSGVISTGAGFWGAAGSIYFIAFAGETIKMIASGTASALLAGAAATFTIWYNGAPFASTSYMGTETRPVHAQTVTGLNEAHYTFQMAGTSATSGVTISCMISGLLLE